MEERRAAPRQRVFKAGTIEFDGAAIDCTVRNISDLGAGLDVASPCRNHQRPEMANRCGSPFVSAISTKSSVLRRADSVKTGPATAISSFLARRRTTEGGAWATGAS